MSLDDYLRRWEIPGVQGIDTRALTRHLRDARRDESLPNDRSDFGGRSDASARSKAKGVIGMDYVREVIDDERLSVGSG